MYTNKKVYMKLFSLLLGLTIALGMSAPAFADDHTEMRLDEDCLDFECDIYDRNTHILKKGHHDAADVYYDYKYSDKYKEQMLYDDYYYWYEDKEDVIILNQTTDVEVNVKVKGAY